MCCLRYEHEFYVQSRKRFPKEGKIVRTKRGEEKILSNDIFRDRVTLRGEDGEIRTIALAEFREETSTILTGTAVDAPAHGAMLEDDEDREGGGETELELDEQLAIGQSVVAMLAAEVEVVESRGSVAPVAGVDADEADGDESDDVEDDAPTAEGAADAEQRDRKPHRRRGRRGGRRNRPGGAGRGPRDDTPSAAPDRGET